MTVWVIEDSAEAAGVTFPAVRAGIDARVKRINAQGGLGGRGRAVQVKFCVTNFDPNAAAKCARDAVADPNAVAAGPSVSANGDAVLPILEQGGLALVGSTAFAGKDGTSTVSFPTMGGLIAATGCQATVLRDKAGAKKIGVARGDTPGADQVSGLLTGLGVPPVGEVVTPVANPDYSAEAGAITAKSDAVILAQDGGTAMKMVQALGRLGNKLPLAGSGGQGWTPKAIANVAAAAEGIYLSLWYATDDSPGAAAYLKDLAAVKGLDLSDDLAKLGWVGFDLINQVATKTKTVDRKSMLAGLQATMSFNAGGLTPSINFTKPGGLLGGSQPRFVNESCAYGQIKGGKVVGLGAFVTPFSK